MKGADTVTAVTAELTQFHITRVTALGPVQLSHHVTEVEFSGVVNLNIPKQIQPNPSGGLVVPG